VAERSLLGRLAARAGILPGYVDQTGREHRRTSDRTRVALLAAMGLDASTEAAAARTLGALERARRERVVPPVRVVPEGAAEAGRVDARVFWTARGPVEWTVERHAEDGRVARAAGETRQGPGGRLALRLPGPVPAAGYHHVTVRLRAGGEERSATQRLVVVPRRCPTPREVLGGRRVFGLCVNLWAVRSERNWGVGDLTDLRALIGFGAEIGAAFVGLNPLHALRNGGPDVSPYSPLSRLFRNVLYLDVEAIPELAESPEAQALLASADLRREREALRRAERVDHARILALERPVWAALHRTFAARHRGRNTPRGRAYARWIAEGGQALADFATFLVLDERHGREWSAWPAARAPETDAFRAAHSEAVDLHCWLQFELDRQLGEAAREARARGLPIGVYQDLAIGSAPDGSDRWAFGALFADRVTVGSPPDPYLPAGQDWGFPPLDPQRLAEDGYRYWTALVRAGLRHAGALRLDHVMGLFRQFWIPAGRPPRDGAYVRFPAEDLLGVLALESRRAGALVVGEDLGTVPRGLPRVLARWGILSSRVLYFERTRRGAFRPSARYPARALLTATTHDLPSLAAFWRGHDLTLRRAAGVIPTDARLRALRAERARERAALVRRLVAEGCLVAGGPPSSDAALAAAVHAFLCRTPAALVGLWLDDLAGEVEPVNLPGVGPDRFPSWTRRLGLALEAMPDDAGVRRALAGAAARARRRLTAPVPARARRAPVA
jgi:4-alpha-glucanotransferase